MNTQTVTNSTTTTATAPAMTGRTGDMYLDEAHMSVYLREVDEWIDEKIALEETGMLYNFFQNVAEAVSTETGVIIHAKEDFTLDDQFALPGYGDDEACRFVLEDVAEVYRSYGRKTYMDWVWVLHFAVEKTELEARDLYDTMFNDDWAERCMLEMEE
jgi:hypothetical protein